MRVQINNKMLSDSPYSESNKDLFIPLHEYTHNFIQDIKNGPATCYFISGYRGAGKSSFINRIKAEFEKPNTEETKDIWTKFKTWLQQLVKKPKNEEFEEVVFVNVNFSRYHNQTNLLRKLIRGLYLKLKKLDSFKKLKKSEKYKSSENQFVLGLEELYEKTFYDTSHNSVKSSKKEFVTSFNIQIQLLKLILAVVLFTICTVDLINNSISEEVLDVIGEMLSVVLIFTLTFKITYSRVKKDDFNRKSMYDDEIADYHFDRILRELKDKGYRIVFVLDELDKVEKTEMNKLLKEIKPYLVSGEASFIAVAGQKLYYKYEQAKSKDDDILSSIFSKFIHISLFSREEFRILFDKLLIGGDRLSDMEKEYLNQYIDFLIFESKKVPRKFISLIRHNLIWNQKDSFLEFTITDRYSRILDVIDELEDEINREGFNSATRDYLSTQLYIESHQVI